jgi:hypothetical protein
MKLDFDNQLEGKYQEWHLGLNISMICS